MKEEDIGRTKVTSEDCVLSEMSGKYELVFFAAQRARVISGGGSPVMVTGFDKPQNHSILVALEEIRQGKIPYTDMIESLASPRSETFSNLLSQEQSHNFTSHTHHSHSNPMAGEEFLSAEDEEIEEEDEEVVIDYKSQEEYED